MTGSDKERELATLLDMAEYHIMRAPSSGGGTKRDLPDLLWGKQPTRTDDHDKRIGATNRVSRSFATTTTYT